MYLFTPRIYLCIYRDASFEQQLHHSRFIVNGDSYITIGEQRFRYCRYWQDKISEPHLNAFIYQFCGELNDIGLNQVN